MTWKISIEKITNGFVLSWKEEMEAYEEIFVDRVMAFEGNESSNGDRECLARALDQIVDYFNLRYMKHYKPEDKFIKISLVSGDKYFDD